MIQPVMPKSLPALCKRLLLFFFAAFLVPVSVSAIVEGSGAAAVTAAGTAAGTTRWYRSNASGMALELISSRLVAIRNKHSLSVETVSPARLPEILLPYFNDSYKVELRTLFENGRELRHQWIFRDSRNFAMLVASGSACFFGGETAAENAEEERRTGFIEMMNSDGLVVRERVFESDFSQWEFRFFFEEGILISAETWFKGAPVQAADEDGEDEEEGENGEPAPVPSFALVFTDFYRYNRSGSLRAIDRIFHEGAEEELNRAFVPRIGPNIYFGRETGTLAVFYTPQFILSAINIEGARVSYTLDSRGRIMSEVWRDDEGNVVGELLNSWSGDRIYSVLWRTSDDERLVEYEYNDAGDRIIERNFRRGVLERVVTLRDNRDIEEIFVNGRLVLRAVWEDGLKISEERVTQQIGRGH